MSHRYGKRPSTREKLEALKGGVELPVDPYVLSTVADPGPDERVVLDLASAYARAEDPDYVVVSWANQVKAAKFFNENGLAKTLREVERVSGA